MRLATKIAGGLGLSAALGYLGYYLNEVLRTERPRYRVRRSDGAFEVRDYPPLLTAATIGHGRREDALQSGFRALADYIFAKSRPGPTIAMTAPVLQDRGPDHSWRTRFVMPAGYQPGSLPEPPTGVTIERAPGRRVAAVRFAGGQDDRRIAAKVAELQSWLAQEGLTADGEPEYAFYNSPMIAPPLRRNEVLIPIV